MPEKQEQTSQGDKNGKLFNLRDARMECTRSHDHLVTGGRLTLHQKGEGFQKSGYCSDASYPVAATLTHSFLQSEYGDDPPYKGHRAGQKMCISALHFKKAIREMGPDTGPEVDLQATSERALEVVSMGDLKCFSGKHKRGGGL